MSVIFKSRFVPAVVATVTLSIPIMALTSATPSRSSDAANDSSNPYAIITDRNIFRLNPPPPPPKPEEKPAELPKVNFNGSYQVGDRVLVLFSIPPKDAKSQVAYLKLSPGEAQNGLELVSIHPDQKEVEVLVNGTKETLSLATNTPSAGSKAVAAAAPVPTAPPGAAPTAPSAIVVGGHRDDSSGYGAVTVAGGGGATSGGGNNNSSVTTAGGGYNTGGDVAVAGGSQYAGANFGGNQGGQNATPVPTQVPTIGQQAASMIIHKALSGSQGIAYPPLPPPVAQAESELGGGGPPAPP